MPQNGCTPRNAGQPREVIISNYRLTAHALRQSLAKGFNPDAVLRAASDPAITYANGRYVGQVRHIRDGIVAVVDPTAHSVITVYANVVETDLRPDQKDADAVRYGRGRSRR